jgi:nucleotide-binding universal stress UspA family protein
VIESLPHLPLLLDESQITRIKRQMKEVTQTMRKTMENEMAKRIKLCKKNKIKAELKVTSGNPADEILKILANQKIDLIVMAKRRKIKGIKRIMTLSSVSRKILEHISCPVLIIDVEKK